MISLICVYNNEKIMNELLLKSLNKQTFRDYEFIPVDSKLLGYKSASEALNYGASKATGDILVFVHQDIEFLYENSLELINKYSKENSFGIAGVAGAIGENNFSVSSSVIMGENRIQAGEKNTIVRNSYALDECLMIVKKDQFKNFNYYGTTWHFYGVEYSQRCLEHNENVLLFPIEIYHASAANSLDKTYFITLNKYGKENKQVKLIRTCCGYFKNNINLSLYCFYRKMKLKIKKMLRKK